MSQINMYSAFYVKFLLMDIDIYFWLSVKKHTEAEFEECTVTRVHSSYPWGKREGSGREVLGKELSHLFCYVSTLL